MSHCEVYLQFSLFEADGITIREAALFDSHMILSDIARFRDCAKTFKNIILCHNAHDAANSVLSSMNVPIEANDIDGINNEIRRRIYREIIKPLHNGQALY